MKIDIIDIFIVIVYNHIMLVSASRQAGARWRCACRQCRRRGRAGRAGGRGHAAPRASIVECAICHSLNEHTTTSSIYKWRDGTLHSCCAQVPCCFCQLTQMPDVDLIAQAAAGYGA